MLKKKPPTEYTKDMRIKNVEKLLKIKELFFATTAIVVTLLNLWLSSKLYPLAQDISNNSNKLLANEARINDIDNKCEKIDDKIGKELHYIRERIDNIYNLIK